MGADAAPEKIRSVLKGMLDKLVTCTVAESGGSAKGPNTIALFADEGGALAAVLIADLPFAAASAAALSLAPPARAEDAVAAGSLGENLEADAHEVMNICGQVVSEIVGRPCRLSESAQAEKPDGNAAELVSASSDSIEMKVEIEGYCGGHLAMYLAS